MLIWWSRPIISMMIAMLCDDDVNDNVGMPMPVPLLMLTMPMILPPPKWRPTLLMKPTTMPMTPTKVMDANDANIDNDTPQQCCQHQCDDANHQHMFADTGNSDANTTTINADTNTADNVNTY